VAIGEQVPGPYIHEICSACGSQLSGLELYVGVGCCLVSPHLLRLKVCSRGGLLRRVPITIWNPQDSIKETKGLHRADALSIKRVGPCPECDPETPVTGPFLGLEAA
jgi:hypothetical protein